MDWNKLDDYSCFAFSLLLETLRSELEYGNIHYVKGSFFISGKSLCKTKDVGYRQRNHLAFELGPEFGLLPEVIVPGILPQLGPLV